MNYVATGYEKRDNIFVVALERQDEEGTMKFFVEVWLDEKYKDIDCDWNQYIFNLNSAEDMLRKKIQEDTDEFDDASSIAVCYLEEQGVVIQNNNGEWLLNNLEDFDISESADFEVWLLGYDENNDITDFDYFVKSFDNSADAVEFAKDLCEKGIQSIKETDDSFYIPADVKAVNVLVETVITDDTGNSENVDTVFDKIIKGDF